MLTYRISISNLVAILKVTEFAVSFRTDRQFNFTLSSKRAGRSMLHNSGIDDERVVEGGG
jgi:hypothetical protein